MSEPLARRTLLMFRSRTEAIAELRSAGQPRAAVPTCVFLDDLQGGRSGQKKRRDLEAAPSNFFLYI